QCPDAARRICGLQPTWVGCGNNKRQAVIIPRWHPIWRTAGMKSYIGIKPLVLAIGALAIAAGAHAETIKIGIPQPMTGPATQYGDQIQAGALTAIEAFNAAGGVKGKKLEPLLI